MIYISILRGINVGGRKVLMTDLKALYESLGFTDIVTYIQSGNVIFKSDTKLSEIKLSEKVAETIEKKYNFSVPVIIRRAEEIKNAIAKNPFLKEKDILLDKLHITFLAEEPDAAYIESIKDLDYPPDRFLIKGREVYLHCPVSYGETKLSNTFFEKKLKVAATTRNWNTVNKLLELANQL